jgi:hypothetical protein
MYSDHLFIHSFIHSFTYLCTYVFIYLFIYLHINSVEELEENGHLEDLGMRGEDNMKIRMWTGYIWLRI